MAVRIRDNMEVIVCAAKSEARLGDCYLDDHIHYTLSIRLGVLCCIGQNSDGADLWKFCAPGIEPSYVRRQERGTRKLTPDMLPASMQPFAVDRVLKCKDCTHYPAGPGPHWLRCRRDNKQIHYDADACEYIEE